MKDEIFFRDKLEDEWEANEVYAILSECDKDFEPPLSERGSTVQKTWEKKSGDGVRNYFNEVAKQHTLLLKREKKIIAFLSFRSMETSLDKGTQRKTTENELPSLTQCTA